MNIVHNEHKLTKYVGIALDNLKRNDVVLWESMSWDGVVFVMSNRIRRCAGLCKFYRNCDVRLEFSESLFGVMSEELKLDTVIHEMSHAICFRMGLDKGHGSNFKRVCKLMGGSGDRVLSVVGEVKRNMVKRWVYTRRDNHSVLYIRTSQESKRIFDEMEDAVLLGVVKLNINEKTVKWEQLCHTSLSALNPLSGWKLVS